MKPKQDNEAWRSLALITIALLLRKETRTARIDPPRTWLRRGATRRRLGVGKFFFARLIADGSLTPVYLCKGSKQKQRAFFCVEQIEALERGKRP